jgi:glycosyltransferase involved in cell wall biosynthesis
MTHPTGVVWAGPILDRGGFGNVARNYIRALLAARVPVRTYDLGYDHTEVDSKTRDLMHGCLTADVGEMPIGVAQCFPTLIPEVSFHDTCAKVSVSLFETHSIPHSWVGPSNSVDQVWVPSNFNKESYSLAGVDKERIRVIPIPADCDYFRPGYPRIKIPGASGFIFLFVFSFGWRKGFDLLLRSYLKEFSSSEDVTLVMKVYKGNPQVSDLGKAILASASPECNHIGPAAPRVVILPGPIPQDDLRALYASCDLYVSTDRAKGWDMPCMEAMAMGKAAATIDWSGSTQFMNSRNSFLIKPSPIMESVDGRLLAANKLYEGQLWPRVEEDEVRKVLRLAYEDRDQVREKGAIASQDIRDNYSFGRVGEYFREVLETIPIRSPGGRNAGVRMSLRWKAKRILGRSMKWVFRSLRS